MLEKPRSRNWRCNFGLVEVQGPLLCTISLVFDAQTFWLNSLMREVSRGLIDQHNWNVTERCARLG